MGGGRYSTNNRVNAAAAAAAAARAQPALKPWEIQRNAALASGPAFSPVVNEPVVNLPTKSVVQPAPEEFASLASPFDVDFSELDFGGYGGLDLDLSGLDVDALREVVSPTPASVERVPTTASVSDGLQVQDFGTQPKFESPDEALANYGNVFNTLKEQEEQVNKVYSYNQFDPGDFGRSSVSLREGSRAAGTGLAEYVKQNEIPLSKVIDGERKYLTTGNPQADQELWPDSFRGGDLVATGPVGTYSTTFQKDKNLLAQVASDPIIGIAANFIPGGAVALTAAKAASGESLSPADIVTLAVPALTKAGMLTAPQAAVSAADAVDGVAKAAVEGAGIAGLGYNNSVALINAAATGDPTSVVTSLVGNVALDKAFSGVKDGEKVAGLFQADDLKAGLTKVVEKVASGEKFDDALLAGLGTYVKEGGTLRLPTPDGFDLDIDLGIIEDVVKAAVKPIESIVRETGRVIDDVVLQPVKEVGKEIGKTLEPVLETVKEAGSTLDDVILQPVKETVEAGASVAGDVLSEADTAVREAASAFDDAVIQPAGDALSDLDTAIRDALPDIDLPDVNLPDVNLPRFNLDLGGLFSNVLQAAPQPAPSRTTDSLFKDELFQFQTEISADAEPIEYVDLGFIDPFQEQTLTQRYPF